MTDRTTKKTRVALIFGGQSAEHEISLMSARNIAEAIDQSKFDLILVGIDKSGRWYLGQGAEKLLEAPSIRNLQVEQLGHEVSLVPSKDKGHLVRLDGGQQMGTIDVAFPIIHGPLGEDGTIQGLLKLAKVPFVGASVLGSAIGMDKDVMKRLLIEAGLPVADFHLVMAHEKIPPFSKVVEQLGLPLFVKPANMGSSIGVKKVSKEGDYIPSVKEAFKYDKKVLIEAFVDGREIECSVLGNEHPKASLPGEILPQHEFYSYEAKYLDENGATLEVPAKVSNILTKEIQELACKTFQVLCCEGLARVDLFLTKEDKLFINEINTLPGFTKISMYPKLWESSGLPYPKLIEKLIELAIKRHGAEQKISTSW